MILSNINSVAMLPSASYFYLTTATRASSKWLTNGYHHHYSNDASEFAYQISGFHGFRPDAAAASEAYPTDSFPSTLMPILFGSCYLHRFENSNEHFVEAGHIAHWKPSILAYISLNGKRSATIRLQQLKSTSPPYRTGPGSNNEHCSIFISLYHIFLLSFSLQ
ncbi:unnamed protein product [Onchocerca flexuosa]|uniref:Glyco_hydro_92N domain-containing protein n=1 Tax=Onchocerca flexuosa TaxID=387005 RepID=A0A183H139_9BILA|nr:unnamed protein product [Onchocerca flexuosa]